MAIENGVQNAELGYILDPAFQIENLNGKPVVGGYICIYEAGTDNKYISYENFDGAQNPFKIPLKADGRAVILGDPSLTYDVYAYDSYGNQLFSRLNVQCNVPGNISIKGADTRIKNTDGTLDISLQTMGNNVREYTVNTKNKLLDVQSPLYFVENSQTATIIGIKGGASGYVTKDYVDSVVSGKLDTSAFSAVSGDFLTDKFEYDDNFNITGYDGSAFASNGQTYSAGTNIDITDNVISVTGLPTSSDVENAISSAVTNIENKFEYNENNYITAYNNSAFAGTNYSAGDYVSIENDTISVTGLQPSGDYATKTELESATSGKMDVTGMTAYQPTGDYATHDDLTAYQPVGDYYSASNPSGFITNDAITGLQPSGDYVTHDEMTGYQPVGDYYSASNPSGFITEDAITGLQPSGDYATHDDLTGYATTALVSSVSAELYSAVSSISGDFELVAGSGVELVDDLNAKTTTINVTAEGTPVTAIEQMIESATSGLQSELDYGYHDTAISAIDASALYDTSAHARINTLAGRISNLSSDKLDASAFSEVSGDFYTTANPSGFITDEALTSYQTIEGMTAYQEAGDYYSASNPSGFISEVPDTYLQNSDLTISDGKITEISGVPLSAGDELPSGVMNTSALEYNAVNEISGYNGSAIAQYGAEKQWLVHDDTLVHASNSAQYALGVNVSAVAQLLGVDETVLWEGTDPLDQSCLVNVTRTTASLSEPLTAFNKIRIYAVWNPWISNFTGCNTFEYPGTNYKGAYIMNATDNSNYLAGGSWSATDTTFTLIKHWQAVYGQAKQTDTGLGGIFKIVGIGRKQ